MIYLKGCDFLKLSDAIYNRIHFFMKKNNITSLWELYKATGIPKATINSLLGSRKTDIPKLTTLSQICDGLNTNLQDFFDDPSFKNIDDDM